MQRKRDNRKLKRNENSRDEAEERLVTRTGLWIIQKETSNFIGTLIVFQYIHKKNKRSFLLYLE